MSPNLSAESLFSLFDCEVVLFIQLCEKTIWFYRDRLGKKLGTLIVKIEAD